MVLVLCLTLLPTAAFAEGEDVSISGGVIGGGETGGEGGGIYVAPGSPTKGGGGTYIPGEDTRTEIRCVSKPDSIGRSYDGTTDGGTIPIDLTFTDGTNEIKLKEGTGFTAKKTFDSADAGWHTVTVEIALIGEAAVKYKLKAGEETFTIGGNINKAYPDLTVTLSKTACTAGEKLLPLLSVEGAPEDAEVTYYYLASALKSWAGSSDVEGSEAMPKIDENTAISAPGTYYVYAKTAKTTNYEEDRSATVALTVTEPAAASVTRADGTDGGTYTTLPAALDAAQDGDTVKLLANHTTNWSDVDAGDEQMAVVRKTLTLDLNGMTVDYLTVGEVVPDEEGGILLTYDGNLTVADNAQGGSGGKIKDLEFVKGSLAIQGGQIGDSDGGLTCNVNSGNATISGGTVLGLEVSEGATVTVNDGSAHAGAWLNEGTLNITGGTFGDVIFRNNGGTIAISGGTFDTITNTNGSGSIPLMPLLADNYAFYQGDNAQNSTEKKLTNVTVRPHTHSFENGKCDCGMAAIVVDNNNSCYSTLQAALNAAANDASITSVTLGQDLTEDVTFNRAAAGALTLNMNGHKLEATAGVPLTVIGGELIIEGAGQVNQNTASNATTFPAISLTGGKLVIKDGLSAQGGYDSSNGRKPAIYATDGELDLQGNVSLNGGLTITGTAKLTNLLTQGTFFAKDPDGQPTTGKAIAVSDGVSPSENYTKAVYLLKDGHAFYRAENTPADAGGVSLNLTPAATAQTFTIGTHTCRYSHNETFGIAYCACGRSHAHRDLSDEKSVLVNGVCPICGYHCPHKNIGNDGVCTDCNAKMVAKVTVGETTTYTADLADALNKAANGTTITLLADIEWGVTSQDRAAITGDGKIVTLNLNGHTITGGWLDVGSYDSPTSCTLKIIGEGSHESLRGIGGYSGVFPKATLDLSEWEGGTISAINISDDSNVEKDNPSAREAAVIVGPKAGTIGKLTFGNNQLGELKKTKLSGGSFNEIWAADFGPVKLGELLAEGYAYQYTDGVDRFVEYTKTLQGESIYNVKVVKCPHKEVNEGTCAYCNATGFAAQVTAADGSSSAYTDIAAAIAAAGGGTVKLLADAGEITISSPLKLDLNGKTAAKLTVTGDVTLASLLPEGYTFKSGSTWISDLSGTELTNVSMAKIPIKSMDYPTEMSMTYGGAGTLLVNIKKETGTGAVRFQWYKVEDGKATAVGSATTKNQFDLSAQKLSAGQHTFRFSAICDGYEKMSKDIVVTVQKANISASLITPPTAQESLTYTGQEQALITAGIVADYGTMQYSLTENGTYSQDIPVGTDAGTYTVWYRVIGDANHNDTAPASVAVSIGKKPLTITGVTATSKSYDGTTNADISSVTFDGVNWKQGTDYTVTASFDDASVGNGKSVTATVALMGQTAKNYFLEQSSFTTTGNITKAAAPDFAKETALTIVNDCEKTYTVTLPTLPTLETPKKYGALTYEVGEIKLNDGYYTSGAKVENGKLILPIQKNDVETTGSVGTATVVIKSTNYEDITLTVNISAENKRIPTVTEPTVNTLTYNGAEQALVTAGKTTGGTMLYRLGDSEWSEQIPTAKNAGEYTVWYKVQGDAEYADVAEQSLTVTVAKKAVTVTALDKSAYTGSTAPDLSSPEADKNYKVEGLLGADTLSGTVTLTYAQTPDMSKPGKAAINIAGTLSNGNYEITYVPGTLTVSDRPSSGSGSSSSDRDTSSSGTVKTETTKNNDGSVTKTETKKDGTVIETTTGKDGSTVKTETKKDGSSVTETKAADGSTATVKTDKNGQTEAKTALSNKAIETAKRNGEPVKAPVEVKATRDSDTAPTVKIELPRNSGDTKVEIPVSNVKPGTVAVIVHPDGTEEIVKNSLPTENGIQLTVNGGATVKIVDNSKDFADTRNHWAKDAIDFVSARGLVNGMNAVSYAPNASTTRAQLWTILARQADADLTGGATWFENAQNWAKAKGVSDGANPNAAINRAQMVTMLWRAVGQPVAGSTANFADVSADAYYASAVAWAVENGITTGVGNGKFDPNATCTRGQIATFLYRAFNK